MFVSRLVGALRKWSLQDLSRYVWILARGRLGLINRIHNADRAVLEQTILPWYAARFDIRSVLFVGCDWYTRHYGSFFGDGRAYSTIDPDPWKARFGARLHHVAGLESIERLYAPGSLDLIVCNGVWGWGLDERADCEAAFNGCYETLRPGGHFLLGWNDLEGRRPLPLDSLASLKRFRSETFEPLGVARLLANPENRHTYDFYVRPLAA